MKKRIYIIWVAGLFAVIQLACVLPGVADNIVANDSSAVETSATVQDVEIAVMETPSVPETGAENCTFLMSATADVSQGQVFAPSTHFEVQWTIINEGTCTWKATDALVLFDGDLTSDVERVSLGQPGAAGDFVVVQAGFTTPASEGMYESLWKMETDSGVQFGLAPTGDKPLRIAVKSMSGNSNTVVPTPQPTFEAPSPLAEYTVMDDECFDLSAGEVVDCSDNAADIKYQYSSMLGAKFFNVNQISFAGNQDDQPEKSDCESMSFLGIPHSLIDENYFCFKDESLVSDRYGWIQIKRFDENGVSFNYDWFAYTPAVVGGIYNPFVQAAEDQVTLLEGECYDVHNGAVIDCAETYALMTYEEVTKKSLQVMQMRGMGQAPLVYAVAVEDEPTKTECETALAGSTAQVIWPIEEMKYYCYEYVPGMQGTIGWFRPTAFDQNGITFDFLTWETNP